MNKVIINGKITKGYFHDKEENGIIFMITLDKDGYEFPTKLGVNEIENIGKYIGKQVLIEGQLRRYEQQTLILAEKLEIEE